MPTIKFTRDTLSHESATTYREGRVERVSESSAVRWIRRGAAVMVEKSTPPQAKKKTTKRAADPVAPETQSSNSTE